MPKNTEATTGASPGPVDLRPCLSFDEMCALLKVSRPHLRKLITKGVVIGSKLGPHWKFDPDERKRFLEATRYRPAA